MGFDTTATHAIFFIAAVVVASVLTGILSVSVQDLQAGIESRGENLKDELQTDIEIINDERMMPYNSTTKTLTVYAKNTGDTNLDPGSCTVIVDGIIYTTFDYTLENNNTLWKPTTVLTINVVLTQFELGNDHILKLTTENGVSDEIEFYL